MEHRLRRATLRPVGAVAVETVLPHVEVERAHVDAAEVVEDMEYDVELEFLVRPEAALGERVGLVERPALELGQAGARHRVARRIEVVEVREEKAGGVPDAAVRLDEAGEDLLRDAHPLAAVGGRDPQAEQLGADAPGDRLGRDHVPEALRHLPPADVDEEAVRDHRVVRRAALDRDAGQERAVEPAPVLVAALQVEVRPAAELGAPLDDRLPADTGIEPDVEDVRLETEARPRAAGAGESGRYQLGGRTPE